MTYERAKDLIKYLIEDGVDAPDKMIPLNDEDKGALELALRAIEKEIPSDVKIEEEMYETGRGIKVPHRTNYKCPNCDKHLQMFVDRCPGCGQRISWKKFVELYEKEKK